MIKVRQLKVFGKKKSGNKRKNTINGIFGEMENRGVGWYGTTQIQITLWNKIFDIELFAVSNSTADEITPKQERAYTYFMENIFDIQNKIETIIENGCKTKDTNVLLSRFEPFRLFFNVNGGFALLLYDADDVEEGYHEDLAVSILPKLEIWSEEDYVCRGICEAYVDD